MAGLDLKRGDFVRIADGKSRPAVIVQADRLSTPTMILICPLTSTLVDAPIYRIPAHPDAENALLSESQLMADRVGPVRRDRIGGVIGRLADLDMQRLDVALALMLDLGS